MIGVENQHLACVPRGQPSGADCDGTAHRAASPAQTLDRLRSHPRSLSTTAARMPDRHSIACSSEGFRLPAPRLASRCVPLPWRSFPDHDATICAQPCQLSSRNLAALLDLVTKGQELAITRRGRVIARIVPARAAQAASCDRMAKLRNSDQAAGASDRRCDSSESSDPGDARGTFLSTGRGLTLTPPARETRPSLPRTGRRFRPALHGRGRPR